MQICLENLIFKGEIISEVEELRWEGINQTTLQDHEKYVRKMGEKKNERRNDKGKREKKEETK